MARKKTSKRWIESGPRAVWMDRYIQWLVGQPGAELTGSKAEYRSRYPTAEVRAAKASYFATRPVQPDLVRLLERRKDVREYFEKVRSDAQFHAKELARQQVAENFEARQAGLRAAAGRKEAEDGTVTYEPTDIKALEHYTRPYLELAHPKKPREEQSAPRVTINLYGMPADQKKMLLSGVTEPEELDEIDFEVVENEKLLGDGEDD